MTSFSGKSALVTGASAGLGVSFARQLAERGVAHLALTARRLDRLEKLRDELAANYPALRIDLFPADLSSHDDVTRLMGELGQRGVACDILINNAGLGDLGPFESSEPIKLEAMLAVNMIALTRLTRWAVDGMLARRQGWICQVGSVAGLIPLPDFAAYAATKAYVNSLAEGLRIELQGAGISVMALCPGPVLTEFGQVAERMNYRRKFNPPAWFCVSIEEVTGQALDRLAAGGGRLIPGLKVRIPMLLSEGTPRWLLRLIFNPRSAQFQRAREAGTKS